MTNSRFAGNGTASTDGGAIYSSDSTTDRERLHLRRQHRLQGGAIAVDGGTVTVANSTLYGNNASYGGGIENLAGGSTTVINSTIAGNNAGPIGAGVEVSTTGTVTLKNTIVANNPTGENCAGAIVNGGGNLSYPDTSCPGANAIRGSIPCRTTAAPPRRCRRHRAARPSTPGMTPSARPRPSATWTSAAAPGPGRVRTATSGRTRSVYYPVTKTQDDDGECTPADCGLREAIMARNA